MSKVETAAMHRALLSLL